MIKLLHVLLRLLFSNMGRDNSVGIVTGYELDGPGIEFRWGRDFPHLYRPALGPTHPPVQWVPGLSRGEERPGPDADRSPPSSPVVMKRYSLWAVRRVQSFSACTWVHFLLFPNMIFHLSQLRRNWNSAMAYLVQYFLANLVQYY